MRTFMFIPNHAAFTHALQLQSGRAVHHWDLCIAKLNTMAKDLAREGSKLPHIKFLSTDSKLSSNSAEALTALTLDFLRHMCCIQVCTMCSRY